MSLFPAYSSAGSSSQNLNEDVDKEESTWLKNPSYSLRVCDISLPAHEEGDSNTSSTEEEVKFVEDISDVNRSASRKKSSKHKKSKSGQKHKRTRYEKEEVRPAIPKEDEHFYEDKICQWGNLNVPTLYRPAVPLYRCFRGRGLGDVNSRSNSKKKKHKKRYYTSVPESTSTTGEANEVSEVKDGDNVEAAETELSKKTGEYNRSLFEQPSNVRLWLEYARFQDVVWQFEKTYRKGGCARSTRVTAERKLAILDKALKHNPDSEELLMERIKVAENVFPADVLSRQLAEMLEKQPSRLALWYGYIQATQCSLALCTVPAVSKLYNQALERLHQIRRAALVKATEEKMLVLLCEYGLFLRQAGLWEQLWFLMKLYLELNLNRPDCNHFKMEPTLPENLVNEKEEQILSSQLPLSELWQRVEHLREGAHWLPWTSDEDCEDPQRVVFTDDVSDFLHPITTTTLIPNLVAIVLTLLKVPLLPCRDTMLSTVTPHISPWSWDSVETLLPALFPVGTVDTDCSGLFQDIGKMSVGPQYLDHRLGQEHYLEFVVKVFHLCAECLPEPARTAICVWWLRFERLLVILDRLSICKLPPHRRKKLKSIVKDFLKQEGNRNCLLFYREYALIENELGHQDEACKILVTAISAQPRPVVSVLNNQDRAALGSLYRILCELYLRQSQRRKALSVLTALALGKQIPNTDSISTPSLEEIASASERYLHITTELLRESSPETSVSVSEHFLPDFCVDWIASSAWLLFLSESVWAAGTLLEDTLHKLQLSSTVSETSVSIVQCQREQLYEMYVDLLHRHCIEAPGSYSVLQEVLQRALQDFPNNMYFLTTTAKIQAGGICSPWWKLRQYFTEADSVMARIFLVFLARQRYTQQENLVVHTHNYLERAGPIIPDRSTENLIKALFSHLEKQPLTKKCPLIWRLYLRFLYDHGSEGSCKTAFYKAVEECPWVKALYMDACRLIPAELPQVQDLIIEKELRLHVTPEELDVLRSAPT